jgi:hypothetical protein
MRRKRGKMKKMRKRKMKLTTKMMKKTMKRVVKSLMKSWSENLSNIYVHQKELLQSWFVDTMLYYSALTKINFYSLSKSEYQNILKNNRRNKRILLKQSISANCFKRRKSMMMTKMKSNLLLLRRRASD